MKVDVAVIGGGPAGSAAAISLAKTGLSVALIEASTYDQPRVGETFPPEICVPLMELGVWSRFEMAGHVQSPGVVSYWGSDEPNENDFIYDPLGCGWHVDRAKFDRMLAEAATESGARLFLSTTVKRCVRENDCWRVITHHGGKDGILFADYLIDAFGRAGGPKEMKSSRLIADRLMACVVFFDAAHQSPSAESRAVIEARFEGWWYSSRLPGNRLVIALLSDADLLPRSQLDTVNFYWHQLRQTKLTRRWLDTFSQAGDLRRYAACSYIRQRQLPARLATGDAAMAFDPLSSQGVLKAMLSGQAAARTILAAKSGDTKAFENYQSFSTALYESYTQVRQKYYELEKRWPTAPFWQRRREKVSFQPNLA